MDGETNEMTETVGHTYKWGIDKWTDCHVDVKQTTDKQSTDNEQ